MGSQTGKEVPDPENEVLDPENEVLDPGNEVPGLGNPVHMAPVGWYSRYCVQKANDSHLRVHGDVTAATADVIHALTAARPRARKCSPG